MLQASQCGDRRVLLYGPLFLFTVPLQGRKHVVSKKSVVGARSAVPCAPCGARSYVLGKVVASESMPAPKCWCVTYVPCWQHVVPEVMC